MLKLLKSVFCGALLFSAGALSYDMCKNQTTQHYCEGNWGVARRNMPQVIDQVRDHYLNQVFHSQKRVLSELLEPIQNELNGTIVDNMVVSARGGTFNPCERQVLVVPKNKTHYKVLDGHHTMTACKIWKRALQFVTVIWDTPKNVLSKLLAFPGVYRIGLNDRPIGS